MSSSMSFFVSKQVVRSQKWERRKKRTKKKRTKRMKK